MSSSLVKQIAMTIVADDGDAQSKIAAISAKGDELAKPKTMVIAADTGEATGEVDAVTQALARYDESAAKAAEASERLAQVQADSGSSAEAVSAAADKNTDAVLRERQAWLSLGEAQAAEAIRARETADAQQESAAKTDAGGAAAAGSSGKLNMLALGLAGAAAGSVDLAVKFQDASTQLVTGAGQSEAGLKKVQAGMLGISTATATSSTQIVSGMYMIESAGYHGAAGLDVLKAAAMGAQAGSASLATVSDATTTILTDYKMKASDAGEAVGGLIAIVASGKTHMEDLATSLSKVLPTAAALKVPFDQVGGAMATMTGEGVTARLAATHLNSTLLALANPSKTAATAMEGVGLSSTKVATTLSHGGLVAALEMVTDAAGKKFPAGSAGYVAAVDKMLGGQSGLATALELTGKHLDTLEANTESVGKATKSSAALTDAFAEREKDASFKLDQAKTATENAGTSIGSVLLPAISAVMTPIDGFIAGTHRQQDRDRHPDRARWPAGLAIYAAVKAVSAFKAISGAVSDVTSGISSLIGKFTTSGAAAEAQAAKTEALTVAQEAQTVATEEGAVAQEGLDVAMDANPIGLIVLGIAALIGVIILVVTHLKDFEKWGKEAFHVAEEAAESAFNWVKDHWPLILAILTGPIGLAVLAIKDHWKEIVTGAEDAIHNVEHWFEELPGFILHLVVGYNLLLYHAGVALLEGLIHGIEDTVGEVVGEAENVGSSILHGIEGALGIGSPSREARLRAQFVGQGLALGLIDSIPVVTGASHQLAAATLAGYLAAHPGRLPVPRGRTAAAVPPRSTCISTR